MVQVFLKNLRKSWLTGFTPSMLLIGFVGMIAIGFPSMLDVILDRLSAMSNPIYIAILGDLGLEELGMTWQAVIFMYAGGTVNIVILFVAIFIPARLLSTEIDKNTLDVMLSFPIPRWRYLLEKFCVYITYGLVFVSSLVILTLGSTMVMNALYPEGYTFTNPVSQQVETYYYALDTNLILNYAIGVFLLYFALGAISLLCGSIFLDSSRSLGASGLLVAGQYFLDSMGGLLDPDGSLGIRLLSLFHYFKIDSIMENGSLPLLDIIIVAGIGILALVSTLVIFEKREFAI